MVWALPQSDLKEGNTSSFHRCCLPALRVDRACTGTSPWAHGPWHGVDTMSQVLASLQKDRLTSLSPLPPARAGMLPLSILPDKR